MYDMANSNRKKARKLQAAKKAKAAEKTKTIKKVKPALHKPLPAYLNRTARKAAVQGSCR